MAAAPRPPLVVTRHPPERRRGHTPVTLPLACCCCCCCCCLHTVGGVAGALTGTFAPVAPRVKPVDPDFPFPFRRDELDVEPPTFPVAGVYWLLVAALSTLVTLWPFAENGATRVNDLYAGLFVVVMTLPGIQLVASALTVPAVLLYDDRVTALIRLGKITLWSIVGTFLGMAVMAALLGLLLVGLR